MATHNESMNASSGTQTKVVKIPGIKKLNGVTFSPTVPSSKVSYSLNLAREEVTITLTDVPHTSSSSSSELYNLYHYDKAESFTNCFYRGVYGGLASMSIGAGESCPLTRTIENANYSYNYTATIDYSSNEIPTITVATTDNRTLYENDTFAVSGHVSDTDVGNVVTVKYSINGGVERAISATISQGTALPYNKMLTFKAGKLYEGTNAITDALSDGAQHVLRVWAEDDKGGKSPEITRSFYVVSNRSAVLTINPVAATSDLIASDRITISGNVSDPDGNTVTVRYKIGNGLFTEVYSGTSSNFTFNVPLSNLQSGVNTVTVQAVDSYGLSTTKTLRVVKSANNLPLLKSVATYKLIPPNGAADGIVLWVQRDAGDIVVNAEISMGANGTAENFVPMIKESTAYVTDTIEEDEFTFDNGEVAAENIVVRLTMTRTSASSNAAIKLISGVLS